MADQNESAVVYARFSPRPDEATSESNEKQLALIEQWCLANGYQTAPDRVYCDRAVSRDDLDRPALWDAVAASKGCTLVVYALDRIGDAVAVELVLRSLKKNRGQLATVVGGVESDGPERTLVRTILGALAVYQKQISAARTRSVMRRRQDSGERMSSRAPAGKMLDPANPQRWIDCPEELALIDQVLAYKRDGFGSQKIATKLRKAGTQFRGKLIWRSTVERIIERYWVSAAGSPAPKTAPDRTGQQSSTA